MDAIFEYLHTIVLADMGKICNIDKLNLLGVMIVNKVHHHLKTRSVAVSFCSLSV